MSQDKIRQKYMEIQILEQQISQLNNQLEILQQQINDLVVLHESLGEMKKIKDRDFFVSIGSGIYAKAELKDSDNILINVGSGVVVDKSIEDSSKLVEAQRDEIKKILDQINQELHQASLYRQNLHEELRNLAKK